MELLQAELDAGYVIEMPSLEAARARWPRVAIGKANVIVSENRSPRLIIDPSVSGVNGAALIPERYMLPGFGDIRLAFPVRGCKDEVGGFSLDISASSQDGPHCCGRAGFAWDRGQRPLLLLCRGAVWRQFLRSVVAEGGGFPD